MDYFSIVPVTFEIENIPLSKLRKLRQSNNCLAYDHSLKLGFKSMSNCRDPAREPYTVTAKTKMGWMKSRLGSSQQTYVTQSTLKAGPASLLDKTVRMYPSNFS